LGKSTDISEKCTEPVYALARRTEDFRLETHA
jgi:hypothetical protein